MANCSSTQPRGGTSAIGGSEASCPRVILVLSTIISMADQPSSTAAKKSKKMGGGVVKFVRNLIKRPSKLAPDSTSHSNSTQASVSSAAHDSAQGNDAGSAEPMVSSECIIFILV